MRRPGRLPCGPHRARRTRRWEQASDVALDWLARLLPQTITDAAVRLGATLRPAPLRLPRGITELRLLEALEHPGCPVCRVIEGADEQHLFWFLNENLIKVGGVPDDLARSLGFCSGHGEALLRHDGARMRIASTHRVLVQRLRARRRREAERGLWRAPIHRALSRAPCPTCAATAGAGARAAVALARLLEQPEVAARYGEHGHLCLPHLRQVAPDLRPARLERVLRATAAALAADPCPLELALGQDFGPEVMPPSEAGAPSPSLDDPVRMLERDIREREACPVCLALRRAWQAWREQVVAGEARQDLMPRCPAHVFALLRAAPAEPAREAARTLEAARESVRRALAASAGAAALEALTRASACPLCQKLENTRDRALADLFALLEGPARRADFSRGYGLCIGHMARALALRPHNAVRACLLEVEAARLAVHDRDLAEYARKSSWQARAEPKGAEMGAPARALRRFSGFACTPLSDPGCPGTRSPAG